MDLTQKEVARLHFATSQYASLPLDPTEKGYGRIDRNSGFFLISVKSVKPYLDGFQVVFDIGNLSNVSYKGFKLKVAFKECSFGVIGVSPLSKRVVFRGSIFRL
jgi:hypothetical protein